MSTPSYSPASVTGIHPRWKAGSDWGAYAALTYDLVVDLRPRLLVAVGVRTWGSYFISCQAVEENQTGTGCYAVITSPRDLASGSPGNVHSDEARRHNQQYYSRFSEILYSSPADALTRFENGSIDFLQVSGDLTCKALRAGPELFWTKLSARGVVLFQNIGSEFGDPEARRYWEEVRREGEGFEFHHGTGLGVWKPPGDESSLTPVLRALFTAGVAEAEDIRGYYVSAAEALRAEQGDSRGNNGDRPNVDSPDHLPAQGNGWAVDLPRRLPTRGAVSRELRGSPSKIPSELQVCFPSPPGLCREEDSEYRPLSLNRWERIELMVPDDWQGESVQISPGKGFSLTDVAGIRVVSAIMDEVVWEGIGGDLLGKVQVVGSAQAVPHPHLLRLVCSGDDARIVLPSIDLQGRDEPMRLEIGIRLRTELSSIGHTLQDWARDLRELPELRGRGDHLSEELARERAAHTSALRDHERASQAEASRSAEALAKSGAELADARARGERLEATLATVQESRRVAEHTLREEAEATRAQLAGEMASRQSERGTFAAQVEAWKKQLAEGQSLIHQQASHAEDLRRQVTDVGALRDLLAQTQNALQDTEAELRELREEKAQWEQDSAFLHQEISGLHVELQAQEEILGRVMREHADAAAALADLRVRAEADQGRIRSMQQSASWKMTLPLRAAGRAVTGKRPANRVGAAGDGSDGSSAEHLLQRNGGYRFQLDSPVDWNLPAQQTRLRGWCLPPPGKRLPSLRVRCGEKVFSVRLDVPRPDVQAAHGNVPEWHLSGFDTKITLPGGPSQLTIEAIDDAGAAFLVGQYKVRAPYAAWTRHGMIGGNPAEDYATWIDYYDALSAGDRRGIRAVARELPHRPLISVVMPVYNTPENWLIKAIDSVRRQLYPFWELCIADDHSSKGHVRDLLARYERLDSRIKVVYRSENGHISAASNSALELATGEFVALLDHDDELAAHALYAVALELQDHPEADLIYSDEDKIDEEGKRFSPYFKPQWNPDLLLGQNFISHLGVYRREVMMQAGGFRVGYEGCQDWDLALRIVEQIPAAHIRHIPRVLYHWRAIEGSTARAVEEKDYIVDASRRVLEGHCERTGKDAEILPVRGSHFRVRHRLPASPPLVSIIIPTHNQLELLRQGMEALTGRTTYPKYEIIVVDNRSDDRAALDYLEALEQTSQARVLRYPKPFNYSAINNFAVQQARGELICLMNNDMEVITPDWLEEMASQAMRPGIGAVGAKLYYPDDTIQHAGVVLGLGGVAGHLFSRMPRDTDGYFNRARLVQNFTAVTAACLVVRRTSYHEVEGLNEALRVAFNDVDFCLKLHARGLRNLWTPHAEFYHHESASRGLEDTTEKHRRFVSEVEYMQEQWPEWIADDPAYNLNLGTENGECRLASPPRLALLRTRQSLEAEPESLATAER